MDAKWLAVEVGSEVTLRALLVAHDEFKVELVPPDGILHQVFNGRPSPVQ